MIFSLIVAVAENGIIGKDNELPWRLPADLKYFRSVTTGHSVIMGRKTAESLGRPLKDRRNILISRNPGFQMEGFEAFPSLEVAIAACRNEEEVFLIGGGSLYKDAMARGIVDRVYLTRVHGEFDGDTLFEWIPEGWECLSRENHPADDKNAFACTFERWERLT